MQQMAINWMLFGWTLAGAFIFGVLFAALVRWSAKRKMVGQTAWAVVIGVTFTLLAMIPVFGLNLVAIIFCYFAASGIPMIIEYILRVQNEMDQDTEKAKGLAKDLLK
jgi:hypothetical protein